ncbi:MAG: TetR/AcrR family transcriptional regulator [Clostridia bacterium]|nr:TetR/AcrR family transcriptional regulator [Clostridia bacterium]
MNDTFLQLEKSKQERIIKAASEEFIEKGFRMASTNQIVKKAEIGKGMLFHYFNNKEELFQDLCKLHLDIVLEHYLNKLQFEKNDFVSRYVVMSKLKFQAMSEYPLSFQFGGSLFLNNFQGLSKKQVEAYKKYIEKATTLLYEHLDTSCFREDLDVNLAIKMITWTFEGAVENLIKRMKSENLLKVDYSPYWDEFDHMIKTIKTLYYKEAFQ